MRMRTIAILCFFFCSLSLGIAIGYALIQTDQKEAQKYSLQLPHVPNTIKMHAVLRSIDTISKVMIIDGVSPYDSREPLALNISYDGATFNDTTSQTSGFAALKAGDMVVLSVLRTSGPLHAWSVNLALTL